MQTGWMNDGGTWYYLTRSGAMAANQWVGNYYVGSDGAMYTNAWTPDGYWVDASGAWIPGYQQTAAGWVLDSIGWWYQNADGSYPFSTWKEIKGKWYYFNPNGYMETCKWIGDYCVGIDGAMYVNTQTPDGYYVDESGRWNPSGVYSIKKVFWDDDEECYHANDRCDSTNGQDLKANSGTILAAYAAGKFVECNLCFEEPNTDWITHPESLKP